MLREIEKTRQDDDRFYKRWFTNPDMDLFVWINLKNTKPISSNKLNDHSSITVDSFQLSYDKQSTERTITWNTLTGLSSYIVDDGNIPGKYPRTPILISENTSDLSNLISQLQIDMAAVEYQIADFILTKLKQ